MKRDDSVNWEAKAWDAVIGRKLPKINQETGRWICCNADARSSDPFHAVGCPNKVKHDKECELLKCNHCLIYTTEELER